MKSRIRWLLAVAMSLTLGCTQSSVPGGWDSETRTIHVPEGGGTPVLLDGIFSDGEWADAVRVPAAEGITLHLKQYKGYLNVGADCDTLPVPSGDLFLAAADSIYQFHVSSDLGERVMPFGADLDSATPFDWGRISGWYANEVRWSTRVQAEKEAAGLSRRDAMMEAMYPYHGLEFQFRRSKLPAGPLRLRVWIRYGLGRGESVIFPEGTAPTDTAGWATLMLNP